MATKKTPITTAPVVEADARVKILNSFMTCPHRDTDEIKKVHLEIQEKDPLFYAHLASWYRKNGDLRDHNEVFSALLTLDSYLPNRETGLALFREHAPFMKTKILGFIKGKTVKIRTKTGKKIKIGKKQIDEVKITEKKVGIEKNVPTSLKTEITKYLRWLESDSDRFDAVALRNAKDLKSLYASYGVQIKADPRAKKILFEKDYPEGSRLNVFKQIINAKTPEEAAKLIVENKIPYTIAVGLVDKITPSILVALINNMSPQEIINNISSLEAKGANDNPDIKKLIQSKLEKAKKAANVTALKSKTAAATGRVKDEATLKMLDEIADEQVKKSGTIKIPTSLMIDKSGSMTKSIEIGKRAAALISGVIEEKVNFFVLAFNSAATLIEAKARTLTAWEEAFKPIKPDGQTCMGSALDYLLRKKLYVEQIVVVSDEGENVAPVFAQVYKKYEAEMKVSPHVIVVRVPDDRGRLNTVFSDNLKTAGIEFDVYEPKEADYYSLPSLITLVSRKSKLDLVYEIMDTPLLVRKDFR
jgi:hypothetical protein